MAPRDGNFAEQTKSATVLRYLNIFRKYAVSEGGLLSQSELREALEADGVRLLDVDYQKFLVEAELESTSGDISFDQFCTLAKQLFGFYSKNISKLARLPRVYIMPAQYDQYVSIFRECAGDAGRVERSGLEQFFSKYNITVSPERLQGIMSEVDDDNSGALGETEFLILLVKALGLKKRKIGPGQCDLTLLKEEGWSILEIKRVGYECKDFFESGYKVEELLPIFSPPEFARGGVPLSDMLAAGWDCARAKESGYTLADMTAAGCSAQRMRDAGFDDLDVAVSLRAQGYSATKMRAGGWSLSQLKQAGYSAVDLRLAGYSSLAVGAVEQLVRPVNARQEESEEP